MRVKFFLCLHCVLLSACTTPPAPPLIPPPPTIVAVFAPAAPSEIDALLAYHQSLRELPTADLARELVYLQAQPKSAQIALQKAMVLGAIHANGDLARAQGHVDGVLKSSEPDALALKPLAQLLAANYAEMRRQGEQADKFSQQAREQQRRIDQLNDTLEALKAIERTLPTRPSNGTTGAPAASAPAPAAK